MIVPIKDKATLDLVMKVAAADGHIPFFPSHSVIKDNIIVGSIGLCNTPLVNIWLDTKNTNAMFNRRVLSDIETSMRIQGHSAIVLSCDEISPFKPFLEPLGFKEVCKTTLNIKYLNQ